MTNDADSATAQEDGLVATLTQKYKEYGCCDLQLAQYAREKLGIDARAVASLLPIITRRLEREVKSGLKELRTTCAEALEICSYDYQAARAAVADSTGHPYWMVNLIMSQEAHRIATDLQDPTRLRIAISRMMQAFEGVRDSVARITEILFTWFGIDKGRTLFEIAVVTGTHRAVRRTAITPA